MNRALIIGVDKNFPNTQPIRWHHSFKLRVKIYINTLFYGRTILMEYFSASNFYLAPCIVSFIRLRETGRTCSILIIYSRNCHSNFFSTSSLKIGNKIVIKDLVALLISSRHFRVGISIVQLHKNITVTHGAHLKLEVRSFCHFELLSNLPSINLHRDNFL